MINISGVYKSYGRQDLFRDLNLSINRGEKIGLIGPNGAGKTTLFSMILGEVDPDRGTIQKNKNISIGYLPQEASFSSHATVLKELMEGDPALARLKKEKEMLEAENETASGRYGEILHELEFLGFFTLEHRAKKILMGLGFRESDFNHPISELSGGWQMRTLLAKLLTCHYDILLLDEPTNYLDLAAAMWFDQYLSEFKGSFIIISHDKDFLNEVTNYSLILEGGSIAKVRGNYENYQKTRGEKRTYLLKQLREQEKKRQQLEKFISRFHGQPSKASQVRAKRKILEKMAPIAVPEDRRGSIRSFHFPQGKRSGYRVMTLKGISKAYGDIRVYKDFDFEIVRGEKAVLVGENGAGKSTLLKILTGVLAVDEGERVIGHNVDIGYFSQTRMDTLSPHNTVLEEACSVASASLRGEAIRTILGAFLFSGEDVDKKITVLSGGEKSRLILAKLLINPPNFLLLDEPTTHLDVDAVDALIKALGEYEGTLACISHDIHFVRSVANVVFEVKGGQVRKFPGSFNYYWQKIKDKPFVEEQRRKDPAQGKETDAAGTGEKEKEKKQKDLAKQERKQRKEHNTKVSRKIKKLEKEKEELDVEHYVKARILSNPHSYRDEAKVKECGRRLKEIDRRVLVIDKEIEHLKNSFT